MDAGAIIGGPTPALRVAGRRSVTRSGQGRPFPTGTCNNAWLCPDLTNKVMTPIMTTVVARSIDAYPEWAKYDAELFLHIVSGTLIVHSQIYEPLRLEAGDSMYYDASTPHLWVSEGTRTPAFSGFTPSTSKVRPSPTWYRRVRTAAGASRTGIGAPLVRGPDATVQRHKAVMTPSTCG